MVKRFEVYLTTLDATLGSEIQKTRPCLIVSPNDANTHLRTVIIAPMTSGGKAYSTRAACEFQNKKGFVALDQIRTVDKTRLVKLLGEIDIKTQTLVFQIIQEMFAP